MDAVVNVVLPIFGVIAAGFVAGRSRLLGVDSSQALNGFAYYFALPALLFLGMARAPIRDVVNLPFIGAVVGGELVCFALVALVGRLAFPARPAERTVAVLAAIFANTGYMGIPLFLTAFGPAGTLPAVIANVITTVGIIGCAVVAIELDLSAGAGFAHATRDAAVALFNPLVISTLSGVAWAALGIGIPTALGRFGDLLAASAGPCALFAIGLFIASQPPGTMLGGERSREVLWLVAVKLVIHPLATWALALGFGLRGFWAAAAALITALPTGSLAFVVASRYGVQVQLASTVILLTTVISVVSVAVILVLIGPLAP